MIKVSGTGMWVVRGVIDSLLLITALELILFFTRQFKFSLRKNILSKLQKIRLSLLTNPPLLLKLLAFLELNCWTQLVAFLQGAATCHELLSEFRVLELRSGLELVKHLFWVTSWILEYLLLHFQGKKFQKLR